jgi:hypothetical protein
MISVPSGWSSVTGVELNHRSIAASYAPDATCVVDHEVRALPRSETRRGSPLPAVQAPSGSPCNWRGTWPGRRSSEG